MKSVHAPSVLRRHRSLRWLIPVGVAGVAAVAATGMFHAAPASTRLPRTTPAALLAAVGAPSANGFSGTVVSRVALGLPEIPALATDDSALPLGSLLSGSHTLQVWFGSADEQRIALLGSTDETDLFRSGRRLWQWSSADRVAERATLPEPVAWSRAGTAARAGSSTPSASSASASAQSASAQATSTKATSAQSTSALPAMTPGALASVALAAMDPSTQVYVGPRADVADRSAYDLVLRPRDSTTRIGSIHIAVDGQTKIPLAVAIYPRGSRTPAVDVAFTSIRFADPPAAYFRFTPPTGARVRNVSLDELRELGSGSGPSPRHVSVTGSNWSTVLGYDTGSALHPGSLDLGQALTKVSGSWGTGRLLETNLICTLITRDGRIFAGAVDPSALYAAAGHK